jgi:chromosome segregation ATPase
MEFINQYGPTLGLFIYLALTFIPTVNAIAKALGIGQAAKVTANAAMMDAQAASQRAEAETQHSMNNIALQMIEQQRTSNAQYNLLAEKLSGVQIELAGVQGEYRAYKEGDEQRAKAWQQQIALSEEVRQLEKKNTERLEAEFNKLRGEMELALVALNAANAISEERRKENEELKIINSGLEEDKGDLYTQMSGLADHLRALEEENAKLRELPDRVQELERNNANLQQQISELRAKYEAQPVVEKPELVPEA